LSESAAAVLSLFVNQPDRERFGLELIQETGIPSGSLYPILHRLEGAHILESSWEELETAVAAGRRPRKKYRLSPAMAERAGQLVDESRQVDVTATRRLKPT
jgi:DNA-binding PadR family transcriptional regulator